VFCESARLYRFRRALRAGEVMQVLREYHDELGAIITLRGRGNGLLGDGLMVMFNVQFPARILTERAVRRAIVMRDCAAG